MKYTIDKRQARLCSALMALAFLLTLAFAASSAQAAEKHLLDSVLSVRGDCATSVDDPDSDPGPCPGVPGVDHPTLAFDEPCGTAVDRHGYLYVASPGVGKGGSGTAGRIDVFDAEGNFVLQLKNEKGPCTLAVDSECNLYATEYNGGNVTRYQLEACPPAPTTAFTLHEDVACCDWAEGIAVDPSNDHLFVSFNDRIGEYDSAADGSAPVLGKDKIGFGLGTHFNGIDVHGETHDVYASGVILGTDKPNFPENNRVFVFDGTDGHLKEEIDGFGFVFGSANLAVDQSNGEVYVVDTIGSNHVVKQFSATGEFIGQFPSPPVLLRPPTRFADIAIDAPMQTGEAGYESPNEGYAYVTSGTSTANVHLWAFAPKLIGPPKVKGQAPASIGETEAVLEAQLHPGGLQTSYRFQYTTQADFEANGYANATSVPVPDAELAAGGSFVLVSEPITGLQPATAYRFRLVASNCEAEEAEPGSCLSEGEGNPGGEGTDASFSTYFPEEESLPDDRAYELVTPPDTNGRIPGASEFGATVFGGFATNLATVDGNSLVFGTEGGSLPGLEGAGLNDSYQALRGEGGWQTSFAGIPGAQSREPFRGGVSADHGYSFWEVRHSQGSLVCEGAGSNGARYIRRPAGALPSACTCDPEAKGQFEPVGCGSLGHDPSAPGRWISEGAGHIIFSAFVQLEEDAPPTPTGAVYDRTADGTTHVVSLKPDGSSFAAGENAQYRGASKDGTAVAFEVNGTMYVRTDNSATLEVATGARFGGFSQDGSRLFYLAPNSGEPLLAGTGIPQGEVLAFDTETGETTPIGSGDEAVLVNAAADGSAAYFTSPEQLDGAKGIAGKDNLYAWDGSTVRFVATVAHADVIGEEGAGVDRVGGLGLWVTHVLIAKRRSEGPGSDPSRTTPDGSVFVFESHADLTAYESNGHSQVYRYDAEEESLACLSCNPTAVAPTSDAQLQSDPGKEVFDLFPPVNAMILIANVTSDGQAVFFQSTERLVPRDLDGLIDVYEWRAHGVSGCERATGCLALISSGESASDDYLYAMTPDGSDVFFLSGDLLATEDLDATPSIYDARVNGGFPPAPEPPGECLGEACQPAAVVPDPLAPATSGPPKPGNPNTSPKRGRCAKGKRRVRRAGKARCVNKRKGKKAQRRNGRRAAR